MPMGKNDHSYCDRDHDFVNHYPKRPKDCRNITEWISKEARVLGIAAGRDGRHFLREEDVKAVLAAVDKVDFSAKQWQTTREAFYEGLASTP